MKFFRILFLLVFVFSSSIGLSQNEISKEELILERKNKRITKRFVHPKSIFLNIGIGIFLNHMKMSKENDYFHRRSKELSVMFSMDIEIGHKNNFFYETGFNYNNYYFSYRTRSGNGFNFYNGEGFEAFKLFGGYGKRIILKSSNINLINVSAGVSLSYNMRRKRDSNFGEGYESNSNYDQRFILSTKYPTSKIRIFPTIYLGLNKDIRIYKRIYLSLDYKFDVGFITTFEQEFKYHSINNPDDIISLTNTIKGTGQSFKIGIKTRFLSKKDK